MPAQTHIKVDGLWKPVSNVWQRVDGSWTDQVIPRVRVDGAWKECMSYSSPGGSIPSTLLPKLIRWYDFQETGTDPRINALGTGNDVPESTKWRNFPSPLGSSSYQEGNFSNISFGNWGTETVCSIATWMRRNTNVESLTQSISIGNGFRFIRYGGEWCIQSYYSYNWRDIYPLGVSEDDLSWHHYAVSYDSGARIFNVWVDGVIVLDVVNLLGSTRSSDYQEFGLGLGNTVDTHMYTSAQAAVETWTPEEIAWLYNGGSGRLYDEL